MIALTKGLPGPYCASSAEYDYTFQAIRCGNGYKIIGRIYSPGLHSWIFNPIDSNDEIKDTTLRGLFLKVLKSCYW